MRPASPVLALLFILPFHTAYAQQASSASWTRVQQLPRGADIKVKSELRTVECTFSRADAVSLTCSERRPLFQSTRVLTMDRADIVWIKGSREAVSALAGTAIGIGAGVGIGAAVDASARDKVAEGHLAAAIFGILGAVPGLLVGAHTDFLAGPLLYRRN